VVARVALVPVIALALALTACSGDDDKSADDQQGPPISAGPSVYGPLQDTRQAGYDYLTAQLSINQQLDAAWKECMTGKGYALNPPTPSREQVLADGFHIAYGTDIADPDVRLKEGYGITSKLVGIPSVYSRPNEVGAFEAKLPPDKRNAFDEVLDACSDQAHTKVLPTSDLTTFDDAGQDIAAKVLADPRVLTANGKWVACMKAAGYPYQQPSAVPDALDARAKPLYAASKPGVVAPAAQALHAEELKTAAQDWTCRKQSITPAYQTVRNELENKFLDDNPALADRVWTGMEHVIAKVAPSPTTT
jgi:hypothetical protein